jgi:hypothetical protein
MKISGIRIPLEGPADPAPLPPVLLLYPEEVKELLLQVVSERPLLLLEALFIRMLV